MKFSLDHIVLNVSDVERALAFYMKVVGLEPERLEQWRKGEILFPSVRISADSIIDLMPPEMWGGGEAVDRRTNVDHFCLCIDAPSWPALQKRLEGAGVEIELGPVTLYGAHGNGTAVYIRDPDGNRVELRYYE
jgi:catechol 2,3-dioxygenase-like lactoylglutathione lyase family enzyme